MNEEEKEYVENSKEFAYCMLGLFVSFLVGWVGGLWMPFWFFVPMILIGGVLVPMMTRIPWCIIAMGLSVMTVGWSVEEKTFLPAVALALTISLAFHEIGKWRKQSKK